LTRSWPGGLAIRELPLVRISTYKLFKSKCLTGLLVAFATIPVLALWALVIYSNVQMAEERAQSANLATARATSRLVEKSIGDTFHRLEGNKKRLIDGLKTGDQSVIDRDLKEILFSSPSMAGISLYGPDGKGLTHLALVGRMEHHGDSLMCPAAPAMDSSGERWFDDYLAAGERAVISRMYIDPCAPDVPQTSIVIPLKDDGRTLGVLRASFDAASIEEWFAPLKFSEGVEFTLLDGANDVMYHSRVGGDAGQRIENAVAATTEHPILVGAAAAGPASVGIHVNPQTGDREVAVFKPVGRHAWAVLVRQPLGVVHAPLWLHFLKLSAAVGVLLLVGLGLGRAIKGSYARESDLNDRLIRSVEAERELKDSLELLHRRTADVAVTLQRSLLPLKAPEFAPFDFGICYQSATKEALVGGDFYDFFKLDGDRLGIVMGDVAGKGIDVTATSTLVKNVIHAFALEETSLGETLRRANAVISRSVEPGKFITVFLGVLDRSGNLTYLNCGHNPPLLFRGGGAASLGRPAPASPAAGGSAAVLSVDIVRLNHGTLPLGLGDEFKTAQDCSLRINAGDLLLLYTDGLVEARSGKQFFGDERVCELVLANLHQPAQVLADALLLAVNQFSRQAFDDTAVMAIKQTDGSQV
jgi:serine phosphatase RsbU (regulator of sigma subunit)